MKGRISSEYGEILVDSDVIATYTGSVAVSCFGIVGMAAYSMKDGLVHLLRRDSLKYGINVRIDNNRISLTIHCIVAYGVSILTVYENLSDAVRYKVEQFTGLSVDRVDVVVEGIRVIDE
ncbi:MAG: Asp23/Gls24 family envelope stress response protein [Eubacteriales bacterium]|nr:Asp23/Gls24 family envelope stress response protein [Eubacteriales bacterium]